MATQSKEEGILNEYDEKDTERAFSDKRQYYNVDVRCSEQELQQLKEQYAGNSIMEQVIVGIERMMRMQKAAEEEKEKEKK